MKSKRAISRRAALKGIGLIGGLIFAWLYNLLAEKMKRQEPALRS